MRFIIAMTMLVTVQAQAQSIHKCKGADGRISFQQVPCSGSQKPDRWKGGVGVTVFEDGPSGGRDTVAERDAWVQGRQRSEAISKAHRAPGPDSLDAHLAQSRVNEVLEREETRRRSLVNQSGKTGNGWDQPTYSPRAVPLTSDEKKAMAIEESQKKPLHHVDPYTGTAYFRNGGGAVNTQTGEFFPEVNGTLIDPKTGMAIPGQ